MTSSNVASTVTQERLQALFLGWEASDEPDAPEVGTPEWAALCAEYLAFRASEHGWSVDVTDAVEE